MQKVVQVGGAVVLVAAGVILAVLARDGSCQLTLPKQCSREVGVTSYVCLLAGLVLAVGWYVGWQRWRSSQRPMPTGTR